MYVGACMRRHHGGMCESAATCVPYGGSLDLNGECAEMTDKADGQASRQLGKARVWAFACLRVGALYLCDRRARRLHGVEP